MTEGERAGWWDWDGCEDEGCDWEACRRGRKATVVK